MTTSELAFRPATAHTAFRPAPRLQPLAMTAARGRNNAALLVARSQFASKPPALVAVEYAIGVACFAVAAVLSFNL